MVAIESLRVDDGRIASVRRGSVFRFEVYGGIRYLYDASD